VRVRHRRLLLLIATGLVGLLLFGACGGGDDDDDDDGGAQTATQPQDGADSGDDGEAATPTEDSEQDEEEDGAEPPEDVCGLLTTQEVSAALDAEVDEGVATDDGTSFTCDWEDELGLHAMYIDILADSDEANLEYFEATGEAEEIDGLGDRAQYTDLIGLEVLTDHYVVNLRMFAFDLEDDVARERTLALGELVIDRLGD